MGYFVFSFIIRKLLEIHDGKFVQIFLKVDSRSVLNFKSVSIIVFEIWTNLFVE